MKRLATILLVLITVSCSSQTINYLPWYKFNNKLTAREFEALEKLTIPNDTLPTAANNSLAVKGDSLYVKTSGVWHGIASVSGAFGGVTSIGATASGALSVSGSPVTSSGTLGFVWTGSASEYVKGNGVASNFAADVKTVGDARYAYKLHTHPFENIYNGVSAVRNLFSVGAGLSYNPATGVFSALDTLDPANYALITQLNDSMTTVRDSLTAIAGRIGTGGGSTPAGNSGDVQINSGGALSTPASDSLQWKDGGLYLKGYLNTTGNVIGDAGVFNATYGGNLLQLNEMGSISTPVAGKALVYAKNDKTLHFKTSDGTDIALGSGGSTPTLQQVTTSGATSSNSITLSSASLIVDGGMINLNTPTGASRFIYTSVGGSIHGYWGIAGGADGLISGSVEGDQVFRTSGKSFLFSTDGGTSSQLKVKDNGTVSIGKRSSDPASAEEGDMYFNTTTHKFRGYANGVWVDLH